jgi:hypothetical protein
VWTESRQTVTKWQEKKKSERLKESVYNIRIEKDDVSRRLGESPGNIEIQSEGLSPLSKNLKRKINKQKSSHSQVWKQHPGWNKTI